MDFDRMLRLFRALHDHEVDYVLVGGVALGLHGLLRTTEDIEQISERFGLQDV